MKLNYQEIGTRIRRRRMERGWTQAQLAEYTGQEPSNISHIERAATKLGLPTLVSIANALEVSADDLLCDSLVKARPTFEREIAELLSDCTDEEIRILTKTMRAFKEILRGI